MDEVEFLIGNRIAQHVKWQLRACHRLLAVFVIMAQMSVVVGLEVVGNSKLETVHFPQDYFYQCHSLPLKWFNFCLLSPFALSRSDELDLIHINVWSLPTVLNAQLAS